jgi:hypothetical protein
MKKIIYTIILHIVISMVLKTLMSINLDWIVEIVAGQATITDKAT